MLPTYIIEELEKQRRERELKEENILEITMDYPLVEPIPDKTEHDDSVERGVAILDFSL